MIKDPEAEKWLAKKNIKNRHWQVKTFLGSLRLPFRESNRDSSDCTIDIELFGIRFRFDGKTDIDDIGWDVFNLDPKKLETVPYYFGEDLMWNLISKGYFCYLREHDTGTNQRIFTTLVVNECWGTKILEKRIELSEKDKKLTFIRLKSHELLRRPLSRVVSENPGLFDYLL
jgi:hypothetical protein